MLAVHELMAHLEVAYGAQRSVMLFQSEGTTQLSLSVMQAPLLTLFHPVLSTLIGTVIYWSTRSQTWKGKKLPTV